MPGQNTKCRSLTVQARSGTNFLKLSAGTKQAPVPGKASKWAYLTHYPSAPGCGHLAVSFPGRSSAGMQMLDLGIFPALRLVLLGKSLH